MCWAVVRVTIYYCGNLELQLIKWSVPTLFHWGILTLKDDAQFVCYRAKLRVTQHQNFSHVIPNFASIMFYDMELDLNKYSNSKEKISFQIFWKTGQSDSIRPYCERHGDFMFTSQSEAFGGTHFILSLTWLLSSLVQSGLHKESISCSSTSLSPSLPLTS